MKSVCRACQLCQVVTRTSDAAVRRGSEQVVSDFLIHWPLNFLRISACFGERCSVTPVVETWRGPYAPTLLTYLFGDVRGWLLGPRAISPRPSGTGHGFSWVGSLSKKLCCLRTTSSAVIRRVRPECSAPGSWSLLHDNAPVYRTVAVQELLARKQVCVLNYPFYSPDLSPCDYFLFPKLKLPLKGRLFEYIQDIKWAVTLSLWAIPQDELQRSFQSLLDRATRRIDVEGMYFE